ncbi:MAG: transglutaminase domain-containing protein, partial [Coriobacteriia bacterium]|nr:transglutaminase domain-containing protein [Coriobacteriia bacterium]
MKKPFSLVICLSLSAALSLGLTPLAAYAYTEAASDTAHTTQVHTQMQEHSFAHTSTATKEDSDFTLSVAWDQPVAGKPLTLHCTASGGSGKHKFYLETPLYFDPTLGREVVSDPMRTPGYTAETTSKDYEFTPMASGSYQFRVYCIDMSSPVSIISTTIKVTIADPSFPSVGERVSAAVKQCAQETDGSDYQKALWLHDWLLDQLSYDNSLTWSSAEAALCRGTGTCQAYEEAYSYLLDAAGIQNAETRDAADGHTWNAVKMDGAWYQVDCTWDDTDETWPVSMRHFYFGLTDELMAAAHPGHAQISASSTYATPSNSLANNYLVRSREADTWVDAYAKRIQQHLDAHEEHFQIATDNDSWPNSYRKIYNGILAWAISQRTWNADGSKVELQASAKDGMLSCSASYHANTGTQPDNGQTGNTQGNQSGLQGSQGAVKPSNSLKSQPLKLSSKTKSIKKAKLKKKASSLSGVIQVRNAKGRLSFKKVSGS